MKLRTPEGQIQPWVKVLLFVVITRLLLNIPAYIGANISPDFQDGMNAALTVGEDPRLVSGMWARWDAGFYLTIANTGYSLDGKEVAFFPAYPLLIKLASFNNTGLMTWAGVLISNLTFVAACLLLWRQLQLDFDERVAWTALITLNLYPMSFFFSAIYAESLLLLCGVLTYCFTRRGQFVLAGLCVAVAALTRINGFVLIAIPLVNLWLTRPRGAFWQFIATGLVSGLGLLGFVVYLWIAQGTPFAFLDAQRVYWLRTIVWPWQTIWDGALVALIGYGGNETNWFMRATSALDLASAILLLACCVAAFYKLKRDLFVFLCGGVLLALISHGPYAYGLWSASRWVITLFPAFIVLAIFLERWGRIKWAVWAVSTAALIFFTAWFCSGRWVA